MSRRLLPAVLVAALLAGGGAGVPAAQAAEKAPQTLDLGTVAADRLPGTTWTPAPVTTNTSPLVLVLDPASDAGSCVVSDGAVDFGTVGACSVAVTAPADETRKASEPVVVDFVVIGHATTTTLAAAPGAPYVGDEVTLEATVTSTHLTPTGSVAFVRPGDAEVVVATVPLTAGAPGTATATTTVTPPDRTARDYVARYVPAAATEWAASTSTSTSVTAQRRTPALSAVVTGPVHAGTSVTPVVTTDSTGAVTLDPPDDPGSCTVSGADVVLLRAGACEVDVTVAETDEHAERTVPLLVTATLRPTEVAVSAVVEPYAYGKVVEVTAVATATEPDDPTALDGTGTVTVTAPDGDVVVDAEPYTYGGDPVTFVPADVGTFDVVVTYAPADADVHDASSGSIEVDAAEASQTLAFGTPAPEVLFVGETWEDVATNSAAANAPVLTVRTPVTVPATPAACTVVDGRHITFLRAAPCTVRATRAADEHHTAAEPVEVTVTPALRPVDLAVAVTTADPADEVPRHGDAVTLEVTATDRISGDVVPVGGTGTVRVVGHETTGQAVTFTSGVARRTFTPTSTGDRDVLVGFAPGNVDGVPTYAAVAADPAAPTTTLTVAKAAQSVVLAEPAPSSALVDATWTPGATGGGSGKAVTVTSETPATCSVDADRVVTFLAASATACRVRFDQEGDANHLAATRTTSTTVTGRPVDLDVTVPPGPHVYGEELELVVTATDRESGEPVPDHGDDPSGTGVVGVAGHDLAATFVDGVATVPFTPDAVGTFPVTATFAATRPQAYLAATATPASLVVAQAPQRITIGTPAPLDPSRNEQWQPAATGGGSGNAVTVTSTTTSTCTVSSPADGPVVTFKANGACTVRFTQLGNVHYEPATPVERTTTVVRRGVTLTLDLPRGATYGEEVVVGAAATAKKGGGSVAGTVTLTVTDTVPEPDVTVTTGTVVTEPTSGRATVTFPGGGLLAGSHRVSATFTPTSPEDYEGATATDSFAVALATQTVRLAGPDAPATAYVKDTWTPAFEPTESGGPVTVTVRAGDSVPQAQPDYAGDPTYDPPSTTCSVDAGTVRYAAQGPCVVDAVAPAVARRYAASDARTSTTAVRRIPVDLTLAVTPPSGVVVGSEVQVRAAAKVDGRSVAGYGPLVVAGRDDLPDPTEPWFGGGRFYSFVPTAEGSYAVSATFRPADRVTYATTTADPVSVTVGRAAQVITALEAPPTSALVRGTWTPRYAGGPSGNPVEAAVVDPASGVCEVVDGTVRFEGAGTCRVRLTQAGTATGYLDADPVDVEVAVASTVVHVTLTTPDELQVGVPATITAHAVAGSRGVPGSGAITLSAGGTVLASSPGGAWTDGVRTWTVTPQDAGAAMVVEAAFTPDDTAAYALDPASVLSRTVPVRTGEQSIELTTDHGATAWVAETWTPGPVGHGSGEPVLLEAVGTPASACTLSAGTVTFTGAGTCRVTADLPEVAGTYADLDWAAAEQVAREVVVSAHPTHLVLTDPPESTRRYSRPIALEAQVVGRRSGGAATERVAGTVQFSVDGVPSGPAVAIDASGVARGQVGLVLGADADPDAPHTFGATFVPTDGVFWATSEQRTAPLSVARNQQVFSGEVNGPGTLRVGATWTPKVTSSSERPVGVAVADGSEGVCTAAGGTVTVVGADPSGSECRVVLSEDGDTEWAPERQVVGVPVVLNPTAVEVAVRPDGIAGRTTPLSATVTHPGLATAPTGTVTFTVDGTTVATGVPLGAGGVATADVRVGSTVPREVRASFAPAAPRAYAAAASEPRTLTVAPAPTSTALRPIAASRLEAQVGVPGGAPDLPASGQVVFGYAPVGAAPTAPRTFLGAAPVDPATGVAALTGQMPPADEAVTVWASYVGDADHAPSDGTRLRGLPTITAAVDGRARGWNREPVTVRFTCGRGTASAVLSCPDDVVLARDGRDQSVSRAVTGVDGGQVRLTVGGIDVDRTAPTLKLAGVEDGAWYAGSAPPAACRGARDALSGLASCTVQRQGTGRRRSDTATATDEAGNRAQRTVDYQVWEHWVQRARLSRGRFQVKPGTRQRLVVVTYGPQPQLMLPDASGRLRPRAVFEAARVDNGLITWTADLTVPRRQAVGSRFRPGYRLTVRGKVTVSRVTLDVVRTPRGQLPG